MAGRRGAADRWVGWAATPTIWFHAASVGEALTAEPVMRRLHVARPEFPLVLTHTSPSLTRWPLPFPAARVDYAPAESDRAMRRAFAALRPALLVFSRSDLWPEMLLAAHRERVPVAVAGAAVRPGSLRLAPPARAFLRPLYRPIRFVGAVSDDDAGRWRALGVPRDAIVVTGDPRHDQVLERPVRLGELNPLAAWAAGGLTLVAGSVEREDAAPLFEAWQLVRAQRPDARVIIVPHDPSSRVADRFRPTPNAMVVESLGILPDLYLLADLAYVGGGLDRRGPHATIEPAAYAVPTLVATPAGAPALARQWLAWLNDPAEARAAGLAARRGLIAGAARATADRLSSLLR